MADVTASGAAGMRTAIPRRPAQWNCAAPEIGWGCVDSRPMQHGFLGEHRNSLRRGPLHLAWEQAGADRIAPLLKSGRGA